MHPLGRKERDKLLRKADILKAAVRIFATKGYHKATMSDIAEEAQYAVGTLYLYFKNKGSLYITLIEEKVNELIATVKRKVGEIKSPRDKLKILIETQLSYFEENEDFFRIYFSERGELRWTIKDKIPKQAMDKFLEYLDYITNLIKEAQKKRFIEKEFDPKRVAYILAGMMNATIIPWLRERPLEKKGLKDLSTFVLNVFYKGVGTR
ncbi:MAG: TetR/AcrR family transcriptional regulator [Candidatus Omnitrophica bacterium]|nr:TetR/AcrR family transcriptional regulator [Candidatus Omnitrophota bacterium]